MFIIIFLQLFFGLFHRSFVHSFNGPFIQCHSMFYSRDYSSTGPSGNKGSKPYQYIYSTKYGSYAFNGIDLNPDPGPRRPFNFFGHVDQVLFQFFLSRVGEGMTGLWGTLLSGNLSQAQSGAFWGPVAWFGECPQSFQPCHSLTSQYTVLHFLIHVQSVLKMLNWNNWIFL